MDKTSRRDARFAGFVDYLKTARPPDVADLPGARLIPVDRIDPNPYQPRTHLDEAALDELAASIRAHGVLQAVTIRPREGRYQLVAGERRWRAAMRAGLTEIPAIENDYDDAAMELFGLLENVQRADLDPIDEARAYQRLMGRFGLSLRDVAERVSKSHTYIAQRLHLLDDPAVAAAVRDGALSPTVALSVARIHDPAQRQDLIERARGGERITVEEARAARTTHTSAPPVDTPLVETNFTDSTATDRAEHGAERQDDGSLVREGQPSRGERGARITVEPHSGGPTAPLQTRGEGGGDTTNRENIDRANDETVTPERQRANGTWIEATALQTVMLFHSGDGRADRDQVRAALWADLEALDG